MTTADVSADVTTVAAAAAVSSRLSVTLRAPIVRVFIAGELQAIEDRGTPFEEPAAPPLLVARSSSTGLGDITTALRWQFLERDRVRIAGHGGIRWPTGDRENLIGTGDVVPEAGVLTSVTAPHALTIDMALSFAKGTGTEMGAFTAPPFSGPIVSRARALDTWAYGAAGAWTPHPRVILRGTLAFQMLLGAIDYDRGAVRSTSAVQRQSRFIPRAAALTVGSAGLGVLYNVSGPIFATVGLTAPITGDSGLPPGVTPWFGLQCGR